MAGQLLFMCTMMELSLSAGLAQVDDAGQTRMLLHLYNAMRVLDLIQDIPPMSPLVRLFDQPQSKSVWVGGRPTARGHFVRGHLLAWGYSPQSAGALEANLHH
ncbi:Aste57867_824 [Aphanomyces stellatus]|uniref:Aste57867_824 protein n=1 Tax=Aphanomyces stellatus TaxID=120398 RepID=A0A485K3W6_9STRA|nr:hypothetical protein As57867_000823 [Aphanomyces stellatus]VFT78048.1 Aste57867_824 [Aphanomyces stellatus]